MPHDFDNPDPNCDCLGCILERELKTPRVVKHRIIGPDPNYESHQFPGEPDLDGKASDGIADLMRLAPNIVEVSEGDPDPAKRRASVRLEFYGPDATARSIEAAKAVRSILAR